MNERIKEIRKILNVSQREFGEKLGVSRDVISNIEYGRVEPKPLFIQHLCSTYNVNEEWIRTGIGEKFSETVEINKNLEEAINIFKDLSPKLQEYALNQIKGLLSLQNSSNEQK